MKAIAVDKLGGTPALMDLPEPTVRPGAILVKVAAAGMNPFDWKMTDGILDGKMPHQFPLIMGVDGAGIVEKAGEGVTRFKTGDKIYGQFIHAPIGEGSYAQYAIIPEDAAITHAPINISLEEAAAVPTSGMTAQQLVEKLALHTGDTVLIIGATGGVGSFAVQLASQQGLHVIATIGNDADEARLKSLGASTLINYKKAPVDVQVKEQFPDGVNGLIDLVSDAAGFKVTSGLVKQGGAVRTTVFVADDNDLKAKGLQGGNFETESSPASLDRLAEIIDRGELKVPLETRISLADAPAAVTQSRAGKATGKTVIVM